VNRAYPTIVKYPEPRDVEEARFSLPHVAAAALIGEPMDFRTFSSARLEDPRIRRHRDKVRMIVHDEWGYDQLGEKDVITIRMTGGETFRTVCTTAHGDAEDKLSRDETIAKFKACTDSMLSPELQQQTLDRLVALDSLASVTELLGPLSDIAAPIPQAA
jgi:2-methylcitrate dehydratase PrpD